MKKFLRRLSSKDIKPAPSFHHNGYGSSNQPINAQSTEVVRTVNPTFTAFQQYETKPQERNLNNSVVRDHQESESAVFEGQLANTGRRPSSARSLGSGPNSSQAAPSRGNNSQHPRRTRAQSISGSMDNSSDGESEFPERLGGNYAASDGWQPATCMYQHDTRNGRDPSPHIPSQTRRARRSASSLASGLYHQSSMETAPSLPQSIYRSYDSDILSSGGRAFDNDPILATAPSGDWIWEDALQKNPSLRRNGSLGRHSSRSHHSYLSPVKASLSQNLDSPLTSRSSGRPNQGVYHTPLSQPSHSPHSSRINGAQGQQGNGQSYVTPFARYSQVTKSHSMESQDMDSAMRGAAQGYGQKAAAQANGSQGMPPTLTA